MAIIWKGGWTSDGNGLSDTTYYRDEVVSFENVSYIVTAASVAVGSGPPSTDMGKWDTFVSGATGTSGTSGAQGLGINFVGEWLNVAAYGKNDVVRYGMPYRVYSAKENISPGETTPDQNSKWLLLVTSGNNGQTLSPKGVEANYANLIANQMASPGPELLDTYILQDTSELWVYDPTSSAANVDGWVNMGAIQGPQGLTGENGSSGTAGTSGTSGSGTSGTSGQAGTSGTSGISGVNGTPGTSGTTPIGNTVWHTQGTAGTSWTVNHNLGRTSPLVQVYDNANRQIIPSEITIIDGNTVKVDFEENTAGIVIVSSGYSGTSGTRGTSGSSGTSGSGTSGTSGFGVPTGGTSGQTLIKNSSTSGDTSWVNYIPTGGLTRQVLAKVNSTNYNTQWIDPPQRIVVQWDNKNQAAWNQNLWTIGGDIQYSMLGSTVYGSQQYGLRLTNGTNQSGVMTSSIPASTFDPSRDFTAKFTLIYNSGSADPGDGYLFFFGSDSQQPFNVASTKGLRVSVNEYVLFRNSTLYSANNLLGTQATTLINYYGGRPFEFEIKKVTINGRTYVKLYLDGALDANYDITGQSFTYGDRLNIGSVTGGAFAVHWLIGFEIWQ
jgi:hypothetical protein